MPDSKEDYDVNAQWAAKLEEAAGTGSDAVGAQRVIQAVKFFGGIGNIAGFEVPLRVPGFRSTDVDVLLKNGDIAEVGGYAKAVKFGEFGTQLRTQAQYASTQHVQAWFLYDANTPASAVDLARRWLGDDYVKQLP